MFNGGNLSNFLLEFDISLRELKVAGDSVDDSESKTTLLSAMPENFSAVLIYIDVLFRAD